MGMFDSFYDFDKREWQSKAFGSILREFQLWDVVEKNGPMSKGEVQVECHSTLGRSWIQLDDGVFYAITTDPRDGVKKYDLYGHLIEDDDTLP